MFDDGSICLASSLWIAYVPSLTARMSATKEIDSEFNQYKIHRRACFRNVAFFFDPLGVKLQHVQSATHAHAKISERFRFLGPAFGFVDPI